tara:strand:+ start:2315 stop:3001 length:687 start_codon:yes stop_codon:yes gene_type:complete
MTIAQHNQQIDTAIEQVTRIVNGELNQLLSRLDQTLVDNPEGDITGAASVALLGLGASNSNTAAITSGLLEEYATLSELEFDAATASTLSTSVATTISNETASLGQQLVAAVIIGALLGNSRTATNTNLKSIRDRGKRSIAASITESIMTAHGAFGYKIASLAGIKKFKYAGGTIPTTRPFCRTHNNKTYTPSEIKQIWRGTWGGKKPGDPYVTRGGYRCRHYWVPVK